MTADPNTADHQAPRDHRAAADEASLDLVAELVEQAGKMQAIGWSVTARALTRAADEIRKAWDCAAKWELECVEVRANADKFSADLLDLLSRAAEMRNVNRGLYWGDTGYAYDAATTRAVFHQTVHRLCEKYGMLDRLDSEEEMRQRAGVTASTAALHAPTAGRTEQESR